jgi:hypothetical protein
MSAPTHDPDSEDEVSPLKKHRSLLFLLILVSIVVMFGAMFLVYDLASS